MDANSLMEVAGTWAVLAIPIITGILAVIKPMLPEAVKKKYMPGISLIVGIMIGLGLVGLTQAGVVVGIMFGLSASGLWSVVKTPFKGGSS